MKLLEGKMLAKQIEDNLAKEVANMKPRPRLAIVTLRSPLSDPVSERYLKIKEEVGERIGVKVDIVQLDVNVKEGELLALISKLNNDAKTTGIIVQLPVPAEISIRKIAWAIEAKKDVDGFRMQTLMPPTPLAILSLLKYYKIPIRGIGVTIVGQGFLVGKPLALMMQKLGARVTTVEKNDRHFTDKIISAEILISAVGEPNIISEDLVRPYQVVIDVGTSEVSGAQVGDVDFESVKNIVAGITPAIGGIGPLTVAHLFKNLVEAWRIQHG